MNKKVIIIVPCFNVEKYIDKCLGSIFNQSYPNIYIICVDDGSTDKTLEKLEKYKKEKNNFLLICKENNGPASARNAALKTIKSFDDVYIAFVDGDDWLDCDYIIKLVDLLEKNDVDVVCSSFCFANGGRVHPYKNINQECIVSGFEATKLLILDETIQSHTPTKMYKGEIWENLFFDDSILFMEDQAFVFKTLYKANKVLISNYAGYYYRQDNVNSLTKVKVNNKKVLNGLYAYYSICNYEFDESDKKEIIPLANNALAACYLMLIPYYKKHDASNDERLFMNELKRYMRRNKLIRKYNPSNRNNKIKKIAYLLCSPLYPISFKILKKVSK